MVRIVRVMGMMLVAMLALDGVASAHEFEAEKVGAVTRVTNKTQIFTTDSGLKVECSTDAVSNSSFAQTKQLHLLADVSYSGCLISGGIGAATVSTAKYLFSADNLVMLENTVVILGPFSCVITVKKQHFASGIAYKNSGNNIVFEPNISGIVSQGEGGLGLCKNSNNGTYIGTTEVQSAGQLIKWV